MKPHMFAGFAASLCVVLAAASAHAQLPPSGSEIAQKAGSAKLVAGNAITAQKNGQRFQVTPINIDGISTPDQLDRKVVGVLRVDGSGGANDGIQPGTYHLFVAKIGGKWHAYLESRGKIALEATHVDAAPKTARPQVTLARADGLDSPLLSDGAISDAVPAMFSRCTKLDITICEWHIHFETGC